MAAPTYYFELSSVYSRSEATRISTFNFPLSTLSCGDRRSPLQKFCTKTSLKICKIFFVYLRLFLQNI